MNIFLPILFVCILFAGFFFITKFTYSKYGIKELVEQYGIEGEMPSDVILTTEEWIYINNQPFGYKTMNIGYDEYNIYLDQKVKQIALSSGGFRTLQIPIKDIYFSEISWSKSLLQVKTPYIKIGETHMNLGRRVYDWLERCHTAAARSGA